MFDKQVKLGKSFRHSNEFLHSTVGLLQWRSDPSEHCKALIAHDD